MTTHSRLSSFFICLPGGYRANLSDVYMGRDIHHFEGLEMFSSPIIHFMEAYNVLV